jgi:hypothetical protein
MLLTYYMKIEQSGKSYGNLNNLFAEDFVNEDDLVSTVHNYQRKPAYTRNQEICITSYTFKNNTVAVAVVGDTFNYRRYLSGDDVYETNDNIYLQCPLLFKYTSTENGNIENLHRNAIRFAKNKKIDNYEDDIGFPWRVNNKAYVYWVVGPKEVQEMKQGNIFQFIILILY